MTFQIFSNVVVAAESLYVKGDHRREICGEGEQRAGNAALSHVESDKEEAATSHTMGTGAHW